MALIKNPNYAVGGGQQEYIFDTPTVVNQSTGQIQNVQPTIAAADLSKTSYTPTPYTQTPAPSITNINSGMTLPTPGIDTGIKTGLQTGISPEAQNASSIANRLSSAYEKLAGKAGFQAQQEQALGVTEATRGLNEVNAQIQALQKEATAQTLSLSGQGRGITQDLLSRQGAEIERNRAIKALSLSAIAEAYKGNLATANDAVKRAVDAQYAPAQDEIDYLSKQYQIMAQEATGAEKRRIEQAQVVNDAKNAQLALDKENRTAILNLTTEAAKNQAPNLLIQQAQNAKTAQEALSILSKYMSDPNKAAQDIADLAYKKAQTAKIMADTELTRAEKQVKLQSIATGGNGEQLYTGLSSPTATAVRSQVSAFKTEPIVTNFAVVQEGNNFAKSIPTTTTNPADDQALVYALAKALDPGSVVREGEYATANKYSQSWVNAFGKSVTQALVGTGFLSETARKNIKNTIETKYKSSLKSYENIYNQYEKSINNLTGRDDGSKFIKDYKVVTTETVSPSTLSDDDAYNEYLKMIGGTSASVPPTVGKTTASIPTTVPQSEFAKFSSGNTTPSFTGFNFFSK
jgi:hypothetical protein